MTLFPLTRRSRGALSVIPGPVAEAGGGHPGLGGVQCTPDLCDAAPRVRRLRT